MHPAGPAVQGSCRASLVVNESSFIARPSRAVAEDRAALGRLEAAADRAPEARDAPAEMDSSPARGVCRITAVQVGRDSGRRPHDFLGYWTRRGTGRDEGP